MDKPYLPGATYHGFRLLEHRFVPEQNADCYRFEHLKSGASLLKMVCDDPNKTFCIGFRTFPESDNGAPHILEHSVLNGSEGFPVKSPFDILLKGSLSTFLNAFTSKDYTMYPVASMNSKDYFNLMHVYLDAVFNPLIYRDRRIFMQEGWHLELMGKEEPVTYTGVVYNEMLGSFSNPLREMWYQVFRHLFPDNAYGFESGGHPDSIPSLTYEEFLRFHEKYYHPENSYIFLYGNAETDRELSFLDSAYLSRFDRTNRREGIALQPPFPAMKEVTASYPVLEESDTAGQTYLSYSFTAGLNTDLALTLALDLLCELLVNQESAPVRLALAEAGIGKDVSASSSNFLQHAVQIMAIQADPSDRQRFPDIIRETLKRVAEEGIDKQEIEGVINRTEFRLREGEDAQKGLTCLNMALPRWFFADDPITGLAFEAPLAEVKQALTTRYLEEIMERYFIGNPHSLLLSLEPSPGLDKKRQARVAAELAEKRSGMDSQALEGLIAETQQLIEHQQREDTPEALASVPMLDRSDIEPAASFYHARPFDIDGLPALACEQFTNDIAYVQLHFDLRVLPQELIPYASLLSHLLGSLNTEKHSFGDISKALNIDTGGFYASLRTYLPGFDERRMLPKFVVAAKALSPKTDRMFELAGEILTQTVYKDPERVKTVLARHLSQVETQLKGNGFHVASRRMASYISKQGAFNELTTGLTYYRFLSALMKEFEHDPGQVLDQMAKTASLLFCRDNLLVACTGTAGDIEKTVAGLPILTGTLNAPASPLQPWDLAPAETRNEGLMATSNVQYVIKGSNYKSLGYSWSGKMRVLSQVLSTDWLQTRIRVVGGAYGGFSSITPGGTFTLNSYRDPNLAATLENYDRTPAYLSSFEAADVAMTRYIIGTIADLDSPLTPSQRGDLAITHYLNGRTEADVQQDRDAVLSVTSADIRNFAGMVEDILRQDTFCVYGGSERIRAESGRFRALVNVENL